MAAQSEAVSLMEPMLPREGNKVLEDLAFELTTKASALKSKLAPTLQSKVGDLVRSMNCYYSNLIEGHNTHPRDIDRALASDYSKDQKKRALQLEARAHIEVQRLVDFDLPAPAVHSTDYIIWLHREFCSRLPEELLWVENPNTGKKIKVVPGSLRTGEVVVGLHLPPTSPALPKFLARYEEAYNQSGHSKIRQIIATAAAHHRLLWIHPFYDGNGRVTRLLSHAYLKHIGPGNSLWSVSRGLGRKVADYKRLLMNADSRRAGALDGRGNLSEKALIEFCEFFLSTCVDQVSFMDDILASEGLLGRIEIFVNEEIASDRLPKGSFPLLRHAVLSGKFERGQAPEISGYKERQARIVLGALLDRGFLTSESPKGAVELNFPADVVERWFPRLYPAMN